MKVFLLRIVQSHQISPSYQFLKSLKIIHFSGNECLIPFIVENTLYPLCIYRKTEQMCTLQVPKLCFVFLNQSNPSEGGCGIVNHRVRDILQPTFAEVTIGGGSLQILVRLSGRDFAGCDFTNVCCM